jgi:hypothetical protein
LEVNNCTYCDKQSTIKMPGDIRYTVIRTEDFEHPCVTDYKAYCEQKWLYACDDHRELLLNSPDISLAKPSPKENLMSFEEFSKNWSLF